jgi:hypothetical protein
MDSQIRRGVMCVDPKSKLASWFNVGGRSEQIALVCSPIFRIIVRQYFMGETCPQQ